MPFLYVVSVNAPNLHFLIWNGYCWQDLSECVILIFWQALIVTQDLLRVFVTRIARQNANYASMLLQPILSSITSHVSESSPSDTDAYKVTIL